MVSSFESSDRKPVDFVMFAVGFTGYLIFLGGIIVASPAVAVAGFLIKLLTVVAFHFRPGADS